MSEYQYQVVGYLQQLVKIDISKGDVVEGNVVELLTSLRDDIPIDVHYATFVDILNTETAELRQRISELEAENARIIRYAIYPHEKKCMQCNGHSIGISNTEHPNYCSRCDGTGYEIITHASANETEKVHTTGRYNPATGEIEIDPHEPVGDGQKLIVRVEPFTGVE